MFAVPQAHGAVFTFVKIADTSTPIPGGTGNFTWIAEPCFDGQSAAFWAVGADGQAGIYVYRDGLSVIADTNTPMPGTAGNFTAFKNPSIDGEEVAFIGADGAQTSGIFVHRDTDGWKVIANTNDFQHFGKPSLDGGEVAFWAGGSTFGSIYIHEIESSARREVVRGIPKGSEDYVIFDSENLAFNSQFGITTYIDGRLRVVVEPGKTRAPGDGTGYGNEFSGAGGHSISGRHLAFYGAGPAGVYTDFIGGFDVVADTNTPIPDGTGNFTSFLGTLLDGKTAAFRGLGDFGQDGIYTNIGGSLSKVISAGDILDEKVVSDVLFWRKALAGNRIAFKVSFDDGSTGIYMAQASTAHIESIVATTIRGSKGQHYGQVEVTVFDESGSPVSNAEVKGTFTGDYSETSTETTNGDGVAVITTTTEAKKPSYEFCVDDLTHATLIYNTSENVETCESY